MSLLLPLLLLLFSCGNDDPATTQEYYRWLENAQNGFVKTQRVNGVEVKVKYLPQELLIAKELNGRKNARLRDSLQQAYRNTLTLVMSFAPDESRGAKGDIVYKGVHNKQEYTERMLTMNFGLEEQVQLHAGGRSWRPALSGMENTYGLQSSRSIVLAFPVPEEERGKILNSDWELVYDDLLFDLGILHFRFEQEQLKQLPAFPGLKQE